MNDSMSTTRVWTKRDTRRSGHKLVSAVCLTALALTALVVTELANPTPAIAQAIPTSVSTAAQLSDAVTNKGGVINIEPGDYVLTRDLEIRRSGTQLRAVTPGTVTVRYEGSNNRVIEIYATDVLIDGLVITGGRNGGKGGGVDVERGASATIQRSWIRDNRASQGAGIYNEGTVTLIDSTVSGNVASNEGGGLRNEGTATIRNSTIDANTALRGPAINSTSTVALSHTTVVRNISPATTAPALVRESGTFDVRWSIVGGNRTSTGAAIPACGGTVNLRNVNLVVGGGCTPAAGSTVISTGSLVGPLQDNGGPTPTAGPLDGSPAVNAVPLTTTTTTTTNTCSSGLTADQRGVARPFGAGCDLGAVEVSPLTVTAALRVETAAYMAQGLAPGVVEVGAASVPTAKIAGQLAALTTTNPDGTVDTTASTSLRRISLRRIAGEATVEDLASAGGDLKASSLRRINLDAISLRRIAIRDASLRRIAIESISLRRIGGIGTIPLSEIPLLDTSSATFDDNGWTGLLQGTPFAGLPLQSITLEQISAVQPPVIPESLTLASIDLSNTSLRRISLPSALLSGVALGDIPLTGTAAQGDPAAWCAVLFGAEACTDPESGAALVAEVKDAELWEAQLAGADVEQDAVLGVPLTGLAATGVDGGPAATSLRRIALQDISLRRISLRRIYIENTSLASLSLRRISLRRIDTNGDGTFETGIENLLICGASPTGDPCDPNTTLTLGDIARECTTSPTACKFRGDADAGLLLDLLAVPVDGVRLLAGLSLADIALAFIPPEDIPWQSIDLDGALFQNIASPPQPTFHYVTRVTVTNGPADVNVALTLPAGFVVAGVANAETATWCRTSETGCATAATAVAAASPTYRIIGVQTGTYELRVPVRAGLTVGERFDTSATVTAVGPNGAPPTVTVGPVPVKVVQDGAAATIAPVLNDQNLQLGYIGGSGELDVYSFTAPTGSTGGSARILLSNIPDEIDYDLTVYGPRPASLRGAPVRELTGLGDVRFDLDPEDDVLPTDVVDDIAVDIADVAARVRDLGPNPNYALRDISSRRSNNDEEVTIPALVTGTTYVIVVSGYFGDLSPKPYGLRLRLDRRNSLPECAPAPFAYPTAAAPSAAVLTTLGITPGINTLYVTNSARLDAESGGRANEIITSIAGTEGVNDVNAGLLLVDDLTQWNSWNNDRCSPAARNAVATAIGARIDDANGSAGGTIDNIVIVGGDGVIPMAAVPDLTEYSNESTFARDILTNGKTNAVSGTVGAGFLLSDDPYATDRGISILEGDHELYVPDRAIGRLVETATEIKKQLDNFKNFGGQLDPATFQPNAASKALVTGYDFLSDGAAAIVGALDDAFPNPSVLNNDAWDKKAFLDLYTATSDYSVQSPNAHYDFESLLPAIDDQKKDYTIDDLVATNDFVAPVGGVQRAFAPVAALGFTVGCHAGLSVSDVQLGIPSLDWAQLSARNGSQWIGHTTYGYGDTKIVAYSERLAALFARNVAEIVTSPATAPTSLGAAVRDAKQSYLAGTLVLTPYDEKVMQSWTYYGLPMYTLGDDVPVPPVAALVTEPTISAASQPAAIAMTQQAPTPPATFGTLLPDGRRSVSIDVTNRLVENSFGADGSYYSVDGNTTQAPYRPVQPLVDIAIPDAAPGAFGGFLITGLSSRDLGPDYLPFFARPIVDNGLDEERIVPADAAFPATLQRVADLDGGQRLLVAAGQYQDSQRLFPSISGELLPRPALSTDTDAPRFVDVDGTNIPDAGSGRGIRFDVKTGDDATRVVVVFREEGQNNWRSVELAQRSAAGGVATWFGSAPLVSTNAATKAEFFAQAADPAGNVGLTSNKIENFLAVNDVPGSGGVPPTITTPVAPNVVDGRFFQSGATFTITPSTSTFSVDGLTPVALDPKGIKLVFVEGAQPSYVDGVLTLDRGNHTIVAQNNGLQVSRFFIVDPDAPEVRIAGNPSGWTNRPVDLLATASDGAGSGVASVCLGPVGAAPTCSSTDPDRDGLFEVGPVRVSAGVGQAVVQEMRATATDRLGTERIQSTTVRVDNAPPIITVTPTDGAFRRGQVTVTVRVTDVGSGIATLLVNGTPVPVPAGTTQPVLAGPTQFETTVPVSVLDGTVGTARVDVVATDVAGNKTLAAPVAIKIDNARPMVTLTPPNSDWSAQNIDVTVSATDAGSGVAQLCVDGACATSSSRQVVVAATSGTFVERTITASATDVVGNASDTVSGTYKVDKAAPTVTVTPATTAWTDGPVVVTVAASDQGSGIQSVCLNTGSGCTSVVLGGDGTATRTVTADGVTTVTANAVDRVGNTTTSAAAEVRIDRDAPVLSITPSDVLFRRGPVEVVVAASDARSGLASVCVAIGTGACAPVTLVNGEYRTNVTLDGQSVFARATDNAGNKTERTATQRIDNVLPVVSLTPPNADWRATGLTVTAAATDTDSGVASLCVDGACGPAASQSLTIDAAPGGITDRTVTATATDKVGNVGTAIGVYKIDRAAPGVTVTPATTNWTKNVVVVDVVASDQGSGLQTVCLSAVTAGITGSSCAPVTIGGSGTGTATIDVEGVTTITATATDRVGNATTSATATVQIDRTAPTVTITPPTPGWRNSDVMLNVSATDAASGVASIRTSTCLNGTCTTPVTVTAASTTVTASVPAVAFGTVTVTVVVTDTAGNEKTETRTVQIDKVNPTATLLSVTDAVPAPNGDGVYNFGELVTARFSCGDVGSGLGSCQLFDGATLLGSTAGTTVSTAAVPTTTAGQKNLTVRATDLAGNTFQTALRTITVGARFCLNYNPDDAKQIGSAYQASIRTCDAAGTTVRLPAQTLTALTVDTRNDPGPGAPGGSNPAYTFTFDGVSTYTYTIKTTGLLAGYHDLYFATTPVFNRSSLTLTQLQKLATNSIRFRLR